MEPSELAQEILDTEHLRLLRIGYFISAGTNLMWVFFPLIYVAMGATLYAGAFSDSTSADVAPRSVGLLFMAIGGVFFVVMAALTSLKFLTARAIGARRSRTLILVTAGITCLGIPWGTALGTFTFLVMSRPSVTARFTTSTRTIATP